MFKRKGNGGLWSCRTGPGSPFFWYASFLYFLKRVVFVKWHVSFFRIYTLSYFADLSYFFGPAADSIQIDKVQYPDRTVVERCAMIRDSGDKTELVLEMWSRVKGDNLGVGVVIVILVFAGIMVVFTVYRKLQRYQHEKVQRRRRNHRRKK